MKWILLFLFSSSCANISALSKKEDVKNVSVPDSSNSVSSTKVEESWPSTFDVYNGKLKYINFPLIRGEETKRNNDKIICKEQGVEKPLIKMIPFVREGNTAKLYYAESYHSQAKKHFCYLGERQVFTINVKLFPYKEEHLSVARSKVVLSKKDQARAAREWHMLQKIYKNAYKGSYINEPFIVPLDSYITSRYGKRRVFNKVKKTQHLGNDFRAKVGLPIPASNRGAVVFAGDLFYTGNVVILDHGLGVFSLYAHLSKVISKVGDIVERGAIVGLSGMTGRVSGPHLHWGVKVHGFNIDGFSLVDESKNQFSMNEKLY